MVVSVDGSVRLSTAVLLKVLSPIVVRLVGNVTFFNLVAERNVAFVLVIWFGIIALTRYLQFKNALFRLPKPVKYCNSLNDVMLLFPWNLVPRGFPRDCIPRHFYRHI